MNLSYRVIYALWELDVVGINLVRDIIPRIFLVAPAVVDVDVLITKILEPERIEQVGYPHEYRLIDVAAVLVPRAPSHGWQATGDTIFRNERIRSA